MKIVLRMLDGVLAGQEFSFDLPEHTEVRIGRDPAACRLALPEDYPTVSRQHCVLRAVLGRVRLRVNKENPVFVGGAQAWDDAVVHDGDELRLGARGPRLSVRITGAYANDRLRSTIVTVEHVPVERALQAETQRTVAVVRSYRRQLWLAGGVVGIAAAIGLYLAIEARAAAGRLVATTLNAEQRQSVLDLVRREAAPKSDLGDVVRNASASVYCVIDAHNGTARHIGTGWVLDRDAGWIATNSHVAEDFVAGRTFLRSLGQAGEDIPVVAARMHPGYTGYERLCELYAGALQLGGGASSKTVVACDVALLQVDPQFRDRLAQALPVLAAGEFDAIGPGLPVASIGYPAEGLAFNVERPQSRAHFGHVIAVSDFFLAPTANGTAQLVHTDLPVNGGASGSPVLDEHGRVLAIINAGTFTLGIEGRRIPIAGTTYAQRIDLVHELLHADAARDTLREQRWQTAFRAMAENAKLDLEQVLADQFRTSIAAGRADVRVEIVARDRADLVWDGALTRAEFTYQVPAAGHYLFCAMAEDLADIDAVALLPNGARQIDNAADWYPCVVVEAACGDAVQFIVLRNVDRPVGATIVVMRADG